MNKKQLSIILSKLKPLKNFKVELEQYQTDGELASLLIWKAYQDGNIENKTVADLGCGSGILGIGALSLGAEKVYFLDVDKEAINVCKDNSKNYKNAEYLNIDINSFNKKTDTLLMNPPFGVQNRKADKEFLLKAFKTTNNIYSLHKIESKNFIEKISKENGFSVKEIIATDFIINKLYKFHKKQKYEVKIGVWHLEKI